MRNRVSVIALLTSAGLVANIGLASADFSHPTISASSCKQENLRNLGAQADLVKPDDFRAVCIVAADVGSERFQRGWKYYLEVCQRGYYPQTGRPPFARVSYHYKGEEIRTDVDCLKVFQIARDYNVISDKQAEDSRSAWARANHAEAKKIEDMQRLADKGDVNSKFVLSFIYMGLQPAHRKYGKDEWYKGQDYILEVVKLGYLDSTADMLKKFQDKYDKMGDKSHDLSLMTIRSALVQAGHGPSAFDQCRLEVENAMRLLATTGAKSSNIYHTIQLNVNQSCELAWKYASEEYRPAISELRKKMSDSLEAAAENEAASQRASEQAIKSILGWIASKALESSETSGPVSSDESRELARQQCLDMQATTLLSGDLDAAGAAHIVPCL